jgi:hypothetical protein
MIVDSYGFSMIEHIEVSAFTPSAFQISTGSETTDNIIEQAKKAIFIAQSILRWDNERATLESLPSLTKQQKKHLADLRSAIDKFSVRLAEIEDIPSAPCITRANKAA